MRETKVNLKHLLEDIRDSYAIPFEEIILVELIANALDSRASRISFFINPKEQTITALDNGQGMKRQSLADYHNIAATTKQRGKGIGFAGVGTKLSLLLADYVLTETKGGYGSRCATKWHLKNETSAPWKFVPFSNKVSTPRGTAVCLKLPDNNHPFFSAQFIETTIKKHFYPLLQPEMFSGILKHVYKKGVEFFVNQKKIGSMPAENFDPRQFQIKVGAGRSKRLAGIGFLTKSKNNLNGSEVNGLAVSTYGKVIKSGWEWLGINTKGDWQIKGLVEIPALAEILTTNKMDFLKDGASLKKYYGFRKAIQEAVLPILEEFGESITSPSQQKQFRALTNEIERALRFILGDFPELVPLLGIRQTKQKGPALVSAKQPLVGLIEQAVSKENLETEPEITQTAASDASPKQTAGSVKKKQKNKKGPALSIGFEDRGELQGISRMVEDKIWVNTAHPAYPKARQAGFEKYHIVLAVGLALSQFVQETTSPQQFINSFLACWGKENKITSRLLKI